MVVQQNEQLVQFARIVKRQKSAGLTEEPVDSGCAETGEWIHFR
jgi:hypothetical protein